MKSADGGTVVSGDHGARSGHAVSDGESVRGPALELVSVLCRALEDAGTTSTSLFIVPTLSVSTE